MDNKSPGNQERLNFSEADMRHNNKKKIPIFHIAPMCGK